MGDQCAAVNKKATGRQLFILAGQLTSPGLVAHSSHMETTPNIKAIRETLGLTQSALANKIGVAQGDVSNWETGRHKPTRAARASIARLLAEHRTQGDAA